MNTLATRKQSEAIRKQMRSIRCDLPYAMDDVRRDVRQLTDWKYYVRKLPLTSIVVAATVTYLAVPRSWNGSSNPSSAGKVRKPFHRADLNDDDSVKESSFVGGLLNAAAAMALRTGTSLVIRHVSGSLLNSWNSNSQRGGTLVPDEMSGGKK